MQAVHTGDSADATQRTLVQACRKLPRKASRDEKAF